MLRGLTFFFFRRWRFGSLWLEGGYGIDRVGVLDFGGCGAVCVCGVDVADTSLGKGIFDMEARAEAKFSTGCQVQDKWRNRWVRAIVESQGDGMRSPNVARSTGRDELLRNVGIVLSVGEIGNRTMTTAEELRYRIDTTSAWYPPFNTANEAQT